ncbi:unnamed protein product [Bursaphelenchus okinawaensis]|uniref:FH2 domain-containing protein n=1 Tax=Bursaphelenchus okinawaensis TaxID=465554 RepID=A0A811LC82_9BILA|nr:unnamed protein product [Bursaphelenchus okinawaensis]CAG9120268.1 unnamed protein product [Bursaphelenchus okinawaensis]
MGIWERFNRSTFRRKNRKRNVVPPVEKQSDDDDVFCEARSFFSDDSITQAARESALESALETVFESAVESQASTPRDDVSERASTPKAEDSEKALTPNSESSEKTSTPKAEDVEAKEARASTPKQEDSEGDELTARESSPVRKDDGRISKSETELKLPVRALMPDVRRNRIRSRSRARTFVGLQKELVKMRAMNQKKLDKKETAALADEKKESPEMPLPPVPEEKSEAASQPAPPPPPPLPAFLSVRSTRRDSVVSTRSTIKDSVRSRKQCSEGSVESTKDDSEITLRATIKDSEVTLRTAKKDSEVTLRITEENQEVTVSSQKEGTGALTKPKKEDAGSSVRQAPPAPPLPPQLTPKSHREFNVNTPPSATSTPKAPLAPPPLPPGFLNSGRSIKELPSLRKASVREEQLSHIPAPKKPTIHVWGSFLDRNPESTKETIWEDFSVKLPRTELFNQVEHAFAEKTKSTKLTKAMNPFKRKSKESTIPGLRIRNAFLLSLAVNNFKCKKDELVRRIAQADYDSVPTHCWKCLRESFPNSDELDQFKMLTSTSGLDDSYEFCYYACKEDKLGSKLHCVFLLSQIAEKIGDIEDYVKKIEQVQKAVDALEAKDKEIKDIMFSTLTLINFLNTGSAHEGSPGFQLTSLVKFLQLKGDGKLMAWFVGDGNPYLYSKLPDMVATLKTARSVELSNIKDDIKENRRNSKLISDLITVWPRETETFKKCANEVTKYNETIEKAENVLKTLENVENSLKVKYCAKHITLTEIFAHFLEAFQLILKEKH